MQNPPTWSRRRHYKSAWGNDHIYEVVGIARNFETAEVLVLYKPLYEEGIASEGHNLPIQEFLSEVGADCGARPLSLRYNTVEREWKLLPRFTLIE
jgi:hypothetical protein